MHLHTGGKMSEHGRRCCYPNIQVAGYGAILLVICRPYISCYLDRVARFESDVSYTSLASHSVCTAETRNNLTSDSIVP